jgi:Ca-activated chloride channel family protein
VNRGDLLIARPWALLVLLPVALVIVLRWWWSRRRPTLKVAAVGPLRRLPRTTAMRAAWMPPVLGALGLVLVGLSLARPQARTAKARDVAVEGIDIVVALDLSTSMRAADFKPKNRFFVAKEVLKEFVQSRANDRMGLVVFAADAFTQCPLTLDQSVMLNIIDQLKLGVIEDGTAIGNGLATAVNRLRASEAKSKVAILITDGDNNSGNVSPLEAAEMAKSLGIRVYTILVGKGGKVPYPQEDPFGRTTYVEMEIPTNPELLKQIARTADGAFYAATDRESLQRSLQDILDSLEKTRLFEAGAFAQHDELFAWALWPGLALLLADVLLRVTRLRRFP